MLILLDILVNRYKKDATKIMDTQLWMLLRQCADGFGHLEVHFSIEMKGTWILAECLALDTLRVH